MCFFLQWCVFSVCKCGFSLHGGNFFFSGVFDPVLCSFCFSPSSEPPLSGNFSSVSPLEVRYSASQYFNLSFLFYSLCSSQFPPLTQLDALFLFIHISNILVRSMFLKFFALLFLVFSLFSQIVIFFPFMPSSNFTSDSFFRFEGGVLISS